MIALSAFNLARSAWIGMAAASPLPAATPAANADCTARANYRRLDDREIGTAVTNRMIVYDWRDGPIYRAVISERFFHRRSRYQVQYDMMTGGGTWAIVNARLCTREHGEQMLCRGLFQSPTCGYALSEPDGEAPSFAQELLPRIDGPPAPRSATAASAAESLRRNSSLGRTRLPHRNGRLPRRTWLDYRARRSERLSKADC